MTNLLNVVQGALSGNVVGQISSLIGSNSSVTQTALTSMLPSMIKGLVSKGSTQEGAGQLLDMIKGNGLGAGTLDNLSSSLKGGNASSFMEMGSKLNSGIFGNKVSEMASAPGLSSGASSKLMNLAVPILMGSVGKMVAQKNLDASGLQSLLSNQKLDVAGIAGKATSAASTATTAAATTTKSGLGFIKWLLPLLLIGAAIWYFTTRGANTDTVNSSSTTTTTSPSTDASHGHDHGTASHTHSDGSVHQEATHSGDDMSGDNMAKDGMDKAGEGMDMAKERMAGVKGLSIDADGNLLKDGKLYLNKGEFTVKDGEYFGADGKSLGFLAKVGQAIGDAGKAAGGAVAGAATETADTFKNLFGGMFEKKANAGADAAAGADLSGSTYTLNDISFDAESNKITSFSKNEVEGLAAALKSHPDAKITVNVSAADGSSKGVTKNRAQVIHDMLVTLGVADKQISAKGLGSGDGNAFITID